MVLIHEDKFYEPIDNGTKIHAIRTEEGGLWKGKEGSPIYMEYEGRKGLLDKTYRYNGSQKIEFKWQTFLEGKVGQSHGVILLIDGVSVVGYDDIVEQLCKNEGFKDRVEFFQNPRWFKKDFKGQIIHWTDFRYKV
jgi:hypothetical protein